MENKKTAWGGRFKKTLHPAAVEFGASLPFDHKLAAVDIDGSKAHAEMLGRVGLIAPDEAEQIINALDEIKTGFAANKYAPDNRFEDIHMFVEHLLVEKIGDAGKKLHTGRSRNDQVALDMRLWLRGATAAIAAKLDALVSLLNKRAATSRDALMPGYTHLQQAMPVALGTWFGAYASMFLRDISRLKDCAKRADYSPLGAGALAGSALPLDRKFVADKLGFAGVIENTLDAVSDRDWAMEFLSFASIAMVHLSRMAEDVIIWATQEFGFVELDDAFATGSSLMPNKKNPDIPELVRGKTGRVLGHLMGFLAMMKGLPLAYNKDMQEDKEALFDATETLIKCLDIMTLFMESAKFDTERMDAAANGGFLGATALVEKLVLSGIPFRDAHHKVGEWVMRALETGKTLSETADEK